jgi:hypothetical protein
VTAAPNPTVPDLIALFLRRLPDYLRRLPLLVYISPVFSHLSSAGCRNKYFHTRN